MPDVMPKPDRRRSGAIGDRIRFFLPDFGAEVTVVEVLPRILPAEDAEIAALCP